MASCGKSAKRLFHVHRQLLSLKTIVFFLYGAVFSLIPFLKVHADYVGLSISQTSTHYAVLLIASFVGPPLAGYFTDKTGRFKTVFSFVIIGTVISHNSLLLVPRVAVNERKAQVNLTCTRTGAYLFTEMCQIPDQYCPYEGSHDTILDFLDCQLNCVDPNNSSPFPFSTDLPSTAQHPQPKVCFKQQAKKAERDCESLEQLVSVSSGNFTLSSAPNMYSGKHQCVHRVMSAFWGEEIIDDPRCPEAISGCRLTCEVELKHLNESVLTCPQSTGDRNVTFYTYFILRLICMMCLGASFSLMEAAILMKAKQHGGDYGKQRVWGVIAKAVLIPLSGYFIQLSKTTGLPAFLPPFLMFDILFCLAVIVVVTTLNVQIPPQPHLKLWDTFELLRRWEALLLYFAVFCLGAFYGFLDSFLYQFLVGFGSSAFLLGMSRNIGRLVCIPTMFFADTIMNKVGRVNILIAAFICYAVQMLCYSLIGNPWWFVALEVLKFFTSCLKLASVVTLANTLAPQKLVTTIQGTVYCLQYEIGSGIGHLVGGFITDTYSTRAALRVFGIFSGLLGFVFGVAYYALRKNKLSKRESANGATVPDPQFEDISLKSESRV